MIVGFSAQIEGGARMRRMNGLAMLLTVFVLAFVCVLLSGAGRLVAREEAQQEAVCPVAVQVCLNAVSSAGQEIERRAINGGDAHRRLTASLRAAPMRIAVRSAAHSDANGNVLRGASYLRTVYQAFALGDGFA